MKKIISIMTITLLSLAVTSCGMGKEEEDSIVIWTQASAEHPEGKMFQSRIDAYNEANPDKLQVEIQNITRAGAGSGYIDKLNAAITTNDVPDIFTLDGPDLTAYVDAGVVGELNSILSTDFINGFTEAILEQGTVDGEVYGIGYQDSAVAIMYNEDMINALPENIQKMVPSSDEDWTWDEFVDLLIEVDKFARSSEDPVFENYKTAVSLLLTDISSGVYELGTYYFTPLMWGNGANIVGEDGLTVDGVLNSKEAVDAMMKYADLFEYDLALVSEPLNTFHTKQSAFSVSGFWYVNDLLTNYPDTHFRTLRYPKMNSDFDGLYTPSGSWLFARSGFETDEEKLSQIGDVIEFLTNDEAAVEYYHANAAIPSRVNAIDVIDVETDNPYHNEAWKVMKYQVQNLNKARPSSVGYPYLSETYATDIILKIAENDVYDEATIKEYLDAAVEKINKEFAQYK